MQHPVDAIVNGNIVENGTANHIGEDSTSPIENIQLNSKFPVTEHIIQDSCNEIQAPNKKMETEKLNVATNKKAEIEKLNTAPNKKVEIEKLNIAAVPKSVTDTPTKNKLNLTIDIPKEEESSTKIQESVSPSFRKQASEEFDIKFEVSVNFKS